MEAALTRVFKSDYEEVSYPDVFIYTYIVQRISQTQQFLVRKMLF